MMQRASAFASAITMTGGLWRQDGPARFAHEIRSSLQGMRPYEEMLTAASQETLPEGHYERAARQALAACVNPFVQLGREVRDLAEFARLNITFMRYAPLPFRTFVDAHGRSRRIRIGEHQYPDIRGNHELTIHLLSAGLAWVPRQPKASPRGSLGLLELGRYLNVNRGILGEALECLEGRPDLKPDALARALGLVPYQLARMLRPLGVSASQLREAAMLQAATRLMVGPSSLTEIAHLVGYADAAHLSRSFRRATGVAPSQMRPPSRATDQHV
jgi:AraC-like DNA-binding protein